MRCEVLLFAQLAEDTGHRSVSLQLDNGATVADALDRLCDEFEGLTVLRGRIAVAVDEIYQPTTSLLSDGCTIALIPPISGG